MVDNSALGLLIILDLFFLKQSLDKVCAKQRSGGSKVTLKRDKEEAALSLAAAMTAKISMDAAVAVTVDPDWMVFSS